MRRPQLGHHAHHLGNHVAGAAHDHAVADAHVQSRDLVGIVQRGVGDGDAGHLHRRQPRDRRGGAGATDLDLDRLDRGGLLLRRKLVRDRPARRARDETHLALAGVVVQLVDHAVDVVRQGVTPGTDTLEIGDQAIEAARRSHLGRHRETPLAQLPQRGRVGGRQLAALDHADGIGKETQPPLRGDRRIELAQRSGGAVARVGQRLFVVLAGVVVEGLEILAQHDHFAAHFEHVGPALAAHFQRDRPHRAQVRGHVLAGFAVAAGGTLHEHAVLVAQADGQAVQLGFHRKHRSAAIQRLLDASLEFGDLVEAFAFGIAGLFERIAQRQHRDGVAHFGKTAVRPCAHGARGRAGGGQRGMCGFQRFQFPHQPVVVGVGDVRVVEDVVAVIGLLDRRPQGGGAGDGFRRGRGFGHARLHVPRILARPREPAESPLRRRPGNDMLSDGNGRRLRAGSRYPARAADADGHPAWANRYAGQATSRAAHCPPAPGWRWCPAHRRHWGTPESG